MINYEEELKKFHPSPEIGDVAAMMSYIDREDVTDLLMDILAQPAYPETVIVEE